MKFVLNPSNCRGSILCPSVAGAWIWDQSWRSGRSSSYGENMRGREGMQEADRPGLSSSTHWW